MYYIYILYIYIYIYINTCMYGCHKMYRKKCGYANGPRNAFEQTKEVRPS